MTSKRNTVLHLVKEPTDKQDKHPVPYFRAGEPVPDSGIYRVFHAEHRLSHEVTLITGERFPRCSACGSDVHFELIQSAPEAIRDSQLSGVRLYEVPHPDEPEEQDAEETVA